MLAQYFIHYLLNKGILTHSQVLEVLEYERSVRVKLGVLAMNAGLMTAAQVEKVHNLQRSRDKQFGALAVEKGYLREEQLAQLLQTQGQGHLKVIQAVADKGFLTFEQLETNLAAFRRDHAITDEEWQASQTTDTDLLIRLSVNFSAAGELAEVYYAYVALLFRNIVRFLNDDPVVIGPQAAGQTAGMEWMVSQQLTGDVNFNTNLIMEEAVLLEVARRFSGEDLQEIDELAKDSVAEFLNVHNGVFGSNLSELGRMVDLHPQLIGRAEDGGVVSGQRVSIGLSCGRLDVLLSTRQG